MPWPKTFFCGQSFSIMEPIASMQRLENSLLGMLKEEIWDCWALNNQRPRDLSEVLERTLSFRAGDIQLTSWGDRLSVLVPWPSLTVTSRGRPRRWSTLLWLTRSLDWPCFGTMPRLSWFLQPLLRSLQQFRAWKKLSTVLKPVASNSPLLRKLYWMVWGPLRCGCGFMLARP